MRNEMTSTLSIFIGDSLGTPSLLGEKKDIELLVLAAQPADEIAEQVGVDDPAEAIVPLDEPTELRLGQEAELRGRQSFRRRRARLIVDHAVLDSTASRSGAVRPLKTTEPARIV